MLVAGKACTEVVSVVVVELVKAAEWGPKPVIRHTYWVHSANRGRPQFDFAFASYLHDVHFLLQLT